MLLWHINRRHRSEHGWHHSSADAQAWHAGKYLFVKEPNKPLLHLYAVPDGAFEQNYADEPLAEGEQPEGEASKQDGQADNEDEDDD